MDNVVEFPGKGLDIEVNLDAAGAVLKDVERLQALVDILDLNVEGTFHVMDIAPDEIMMALLHLSAIWAFRAGIDAEEYYEIRDSMMVEVEHGPESP